MSATLPAFSAQRIPAMTSVPIREIHSLSSSATLRLILKAAYHEADDELCARVNYLENWQLYTNAGGLQPLKTLRFCELWAVDRSVFHSIMIETVRRRRSAMKEHLMRCERFRAISSEMLV
ncbi:hypothetical protein RB195_002942 [Necator americanus]|uniref:Uncharacterized protein n=1 Tax=Necator americanus TaxID=51031 RepID=A0ABR1DLC6_NECAM